MEVIRRNTDYAFRLMVNIAQSNGRGPVSVRRLAEMSKVPYELACKLLQKLSNQGILSSKMGAKGGYTLAKQPSEISFKDVIEAIQGPVCLNLCLTDGFFCPLKDKCPINEHLLELQKEMDRHFAAKTLDILMK